MINYKDDLLIYLQSTVDISTLSPISTKTGTLTVAPESNIADFSPL